MTQVLGCCSVRFFTCFSMFCCFVFLSFSLSFSFRYFLKKLKFEISIWPGLGPDGSGRLCGRPGLAAALANWNLFWLQKNWNEKRNANEEKQNKNGFSIISLHFGHVVRAVHHGPRTQYRSNRTEYRIDRIEIPKNFQTAKKSRGWLRFWRFLDGINRLDAIYLFKIFYGYCF